MGRLTREAQRVGRQVTRAHRYLSAPFARRLHDRLRTERVQVFRCHASWTGEVALLLLHQPDGLLGSTFHTLDHLRAKGLAPLVVSNAPLSDPDRERLATAAWTILERPNIGYDFGGYRDGILHLFETVGTPARLFLINDSIWFPLRRNSDLVDRARASQADIYGFVLNDLMRRDSRRHLQSYFLTFGPRALSHPAFSRFWERLFLTDDKELVISRCEIPLTAHLRREGLTVDARHAYSDWEAPKMLDGDELRAVAAHLAKIGVKNAGRIAALLQGQGESDLRARLLAEIDPVRSRISFLRNHPLVLIGGYDVPMLKKNREAGYVQQRRALLDLELDAGFAPVVSREIRQWDAKR